MIEADKARLLALVERVRLDYDKELVYIRGILELRAAIRALPTTPSFDTLVQRVGELPTTGLASAESPPVAAPSEPARVRICPCCDANPPLPMDADCSCPAWCMHQQETRPSHAEAAARVRIARALALLTWWEGWAIRVGTSDSTVESVSVIAAGNSAMTKVKGG